MFPTVKSGEGWCKEGHLVGILLGLWIELTKASTFQWLKILFIVEAASLEASGWGWVLVGMGECACRLIHSHTERPIKRFLIFGVYFNWTHKNEAKIVLLFSLVSCWNELQNESAKVKLVEEFINSLIIHWKSPPKTWLVPL